jgi:DNA primase
LSNWRSLADLIDVEEFEEALGIVVVTHNGIEDIARCPLPSHAGEDKNPSFSINKDKKLFNCFACGVGGTLLTLVMQVKNCSYEDAYNFCRKCANVQSENKVDLLSKLDRILQGSRAKQFESVMPIYNESILDKWNESCSFYEDRGINEETISLLKLKYNPEHVRGGHIGPAAIIPHFWKKRLVGYQERWLGDRPKNVPKYTNSKDFPKKDTLYNYDNITLGDVIVVESAMTVAYLVSNGYQAVATFGASVQDEQIRLIKNLCSVGCRVFVSFDNDHAGKSATNRIVQQLKSTVPLFVVASDGKEKGDLNDLTPDEVASRIETALPWWATQRTT